MKIIQVSVGSVKIPPEEGSAPLQVMFNTSRKLASMGHKVVILDRKYSKNDEDLEVIDGVEVVRLGAVQLFLAKYPRILRFVFAEFNAVLFAFAVSRYLKKNQTNINVVHLHLTSIGLVLVFLNRRLRHRMAYTCHLNQWALIGTGLSCVGRIPLMLDSFLMKRVRIVIALSDAAKTSFIDIGKVGEDKIFVIPNGIDTEYFIPNEKERESIRHKYGLKEQVAILFVGRLALIKGVNHLLEAANIIVNKLGYENSVFILAGPESYAGVDQPIGKTWIKEFVSTHNLENNVIITGSLAQEEIKLLYSGCDIFILPSLAEGDPLVTLEAMATGKPLVGTRVGGIPNQIREGWNGFLIDSGDREQLIEKVVYLIDHPEERQSMGIRSREFAVDEFDWSKVTQRIYALYEKLME